MSTRTGLMRAVSLFDRKVPKKFAKGQGIPSICAGPIGQGFSAAGQAWEKDFVRKEVYQSSAPFSIAKSFSAETLIPREVPTPQAGYHGRYTSMTALWNDALLFIHGQAFLDRIRDPSYNKKEGTTKKKVEKTSPL